MAITADKIWMDGELVPFEDAKIHVLTHTLHYGLGAFEGIRCYQRADGASAIFRLGEHIRRLLETCHICTIDSPYTREELERACVETVRANGFKDCYLRPVVYLGHGEMGLSAMSNDVRVTVIAWHWGAYLGDDGINNGIRAKVASFNRHHVNSSMVKGKINGQYVNSILAKREVMKAGYQEAIMLDTNGYISEASGENIFVVRDGVIYSTPLGSSILGGITRDTVLTLARERGYTIIEQRVTRDFLYVADEIFMTGTAAEVTPVRELDDRTIGTGKPGPVTRTLQDAYFDQVRGSATDHMEWLTIVE
ncbi:branched-chain amino acid transaminase [Bradymonadaceae bacterium TMQ3]|uniref:Branched-chain-amino-acid aminotransferase n=1 Tax=Lujinxingia sediminis TaxID=2480984 RepID=A0ABY0CWW0_9DELT|nr:branched-chain amino acid transaminase [Lujinxingia sediminis]RDV39888.1 branched-chain amino acid transaminase [Bradymonadaceae bacterium TMQ3]RVU48066.1 branched-chain amino acid transaminase [Lujinxingia sediminis]TXC77365.1 branched-chain amino acid transaminase [Bradymonadales bacterium TMQ1]